MSESALYKRLEETADRWCERAEKAEAEVERLRAECKRWQRDSIDLARYAEKAEAEVERLRAVLETISTSDQSKAKIHAMARLAISKSN